MEIIHFSHEHPLIFNQEADNNPLLFCADCYGCGKRVTNCPEEEEDRCAVYECAAAGTSCEFFLHKKCAEMPTKIIHREHSSDHPLTLYRNSEIMACNLCVRVYGSSKCFFYKCSQCEPEFNIDTTCALQEGYYGIEHENHEHPLSIRKQAIFSCDACGIEGKDYCYVCQRPECNFWIHKTCALLSPSTIIHPNHNHPLKLANSKSLPKKYNDLEYEFKCRICGEKVSTQNLWLYYCADCTFFVHFRCTRTTSPPNPLLPGDDEEDHHLLMKFPLPADRSADLMRGLLKKMSNLGDSENCNGELGKIDELIHWDHVHPLILISDATQSKNELNTDINCVACTQPISTAAPFYHCAQSQCCYFLHRYCAFLPQELEYPAHEHTLKLNGRINSFTLFGCTGCDSHFSGFHYSCETCEYMKIDIRCASLPTKIKHDSHAHPLVATMVFKNLCHACMQRFDGIIYKCKTCGYGLTYRCATMLPDTLIHDYDQHHISLTYPPIKNYPTESYCEICENEMDSNIWIYYCHDCRFSFHINCIRPFDDYSNVKGGLYKFKFHEHHLTFLRYGRNYPSWCSTCDRSVNGHPSFVCVVCKFISCLTCWKRSQVDAEQVADTFLTKLKTSKGFGKIGIRVNIDLGHLF